MASVACTETIINHSNNINGANNNAIHNGVSNNHNNNNNTTATDSPTARGVFGWEEITTTLFMPVILRDDCRCVCIRMVENELIGKYQLLPPEVFECINIRSSYASELEAKLLTTINTKHCDYKYGFQPFVALSDMIVSVKDVKALARFLLCAQKLFILHQCCDELFGLVRLMINNTPPGYYPLVPYITKQLPNDKTAKFVPQIVIEPFICDATSAAQMLPSAWDIAYLKMISVYGKQDATKLTDLDHLLNLSDLTDATKKPLNFEICSFNTNTNTFTNSHTETTIHQPHNINNFY